MATDGEILMQLKVEVGRLAERVAHSEARILEKQAETQRDLERVAEDVQGVKDSLSAPDGSGVHRILQDHGRTLKDQGEDIRALQEDHRGLRVMAFKVMWATICGLVMGGASLVWALVKVRVRAWWTGDTPANMGP